MAVASDVFERSPQAGPEILGYSALILLAGEGVQRGLPFGDRFLVLALLPQDRGDFRARVAPFGIQLQRVAKLFESLRRLTRVAIILR